MRILSVQIKPCPLFGLGASSVRMLKWNVDAFYDACLSHVAVGGVLRDSLGTFICIFLSPIPLMEIIRLNCLQFFEPLESLSIVSASNLIKSPLNRTPPMLLDGATKIVEARGI